MRAPLVLPLLRRGIHVIAQARIDTALFLPPPKQHRPRRGRPRKYGERLSKEAIEALPAIEFEHGRQFRFDCLLDDLPRALLNQLI